MVTVLRWRELQPPLVAVGKAVYALTPVSFLDHVRTGWAVKSQIQAALANEIA